MPTSELSGIEYINVGPLTTTWTAPESCTSDIRQPRLAFTDSPSIAVYEERCDFEHEILELGDCFPSGSDIDAIIFTSNADSPDPYTFLGYHSPGNVCPHAWTTAGVAEMNANGSLSSTGVFAATEFIDAFETSVESTPSQNPIPNQIAHALNPGETCVVCCPSGFTVDPIGGCYSNFPIISFTASTACVPYANQDYEPTPVTFSYNGEDVTGNYWANTKTEAASITSTNTILVIESYSGEGLTMSALPKSAFTGFTHIPMVFLVNGGDDGGDNGDGNLDDDGGPNAAAGGRATLDSGLATLIVVWGVAGLIGVGLVAPF
ncbi:hypothetical protein EDB80DRAFT_592744 [Ilyonectria destructans]|nr:hypothetical protein EDB80DRAFT_592744 [Ilyonectria destructans]